MDKVVRVYRSRPRGLRFGNFGDELTGPLLNSLFKLQVEYVPLREAELIGAGSVLDAYWRYAVQPISIRAKLRAILAKFEPHAKRLHVWGSGAMLEDSSFDWPQRLVLHCVRGPLTAKRIQGYSGATGDPGILAPFLIDAPNSRRGIQLVPHFVDQDWISSLELPARWNVIHPDRPLIEVLAAIAGAELVISSSLHGLITADAFGIPAIWAKSNRELHRGSVFKFHDHASARRREFNAPVPYELLRNMSERSLLDLATTSSRPIGAWQQEIVAAFPSSEF